MTNKEVLKEADRAKNILTKAVAEFLDMEKVVMKNSKVFKNFKISPFRHPKQ